MAGFEVSTYGRFWVSTEANYPARIESLHGLLQRTNDAGSRLPRP
jgi:hypothetical protein